MNYLAHAFLSFNNAEVLAGNMISDFVKGRKKFDYAEGIQKGIHLHRLIDSFTDDHPVTAKAKSYFRPQYRLYSGAFVDVVYDHFLALDKNQFYKYNGLESFSKNVYNQLENNLDFFPQPFQKMFPYMKLQNWLYNYQFKEGIQRSFRGLVYRAAYLNESMVAFKIFNENYDQLESCYADFFPSLELYAYKNLGHLCAY